MNLNSVDGGFIAGLEAQLPEGVLRKVEARYLEEPRGRYRGQAGVMALPQTTEQVSVLLRAANVARVPVVPYGGGTGLVGGQVMVEGPLPLVISMERMRAVRAVYPQENVLVAEAGAILADVQAAAQEAGRLFPLSLASEGSAQVGGNLSTNAGGVNVLRYGNARELCLGLEAVLPSGDIWQGLSRLRKDNTGYDLRGLLIGAEGTLGIITAAALKLSPIPAARGTAIFVVKSPQAALAILSLARDRLGEGISAFELIHRQGLEFLSETLPQLRQPFAAPPEWSVLVELGLAGGIDPEAELADLFEVALEAGHALDGVIAQSEAQRQELWTVREQIPEANRLVGSVVSHDISVPLSAIPEFIVRAGERIAQLGDFRINCFGHLGDGNLHYNVFPAVGRRREDYESQRGEVQQVVHDLVHEMSGSISAEHGVGRMKADDIERYGDPVRLAAMRAIKQALDPNGILNPGAVLKA
ncbi:FAD-binding oxidoreductase [Parasedimentitalea marina]|uniref:FAD-binding oxidoreductase n=1 Tax=Parasedimentitalea marina TaxID=2483033 RepID=A0A3T0N8F8_9RHOB|nr:FAD-binding oxidoreductase [Parasedimentitalea marina]AZV80308.1 FAD-binding oxidoreductase [Parasedimentitalea marina]